MQLLVRIYHSFGNNEICNEQADTHTGASKLWQYELKVKITTHKSIQPNRGRAATDMQKIKGELAAIAMRRE